MASIIKEQCSLILSDEWQPAIPFLNIVPKSARQLHKVRAKFGKKIIEHNRGLAITQFQTLARDFSSANGLIGGTQDNGTLKFLGTDWEHIFGGDGGDCWLASGRLGWREGGVWLDGRPLETPMREDFRANVAT